MKYFRAALKKYAVFTGRATRSEFWYFNLVMVLIQVGVGFVSGILAGMRDDFLIIIVVIVVSSLFFLLPSISVLVRRLHDINKSGWWYFLSFVPFVGGIWLIVLLATKGTATENPYGPILCTSCGSVMEDGSTTCIHCSQSVGAGISLKQYILIGAVGLILLGTVGVFWYVYQEKLRQIQESSQDVGENNDLKEVEAVVSEDQITANEPEALSQEEAVFFGKKYKRGFIIPDIGGGEGEIRRAAEWVAEGETVDAWTSLITTHHIVSVNKDVPLSAAAYAESVASLAEQNGALILERSVINQDMDVLGIDPQNPPYILVKIHFSGDMMEFDMQKIFQISPYEIGSVIYAEQFPMKTEEEMRAYYDSEERHNKRIELIKSRIPLEKNE